VASAIQVRSSHAYKTTDAAMIALAAAHGAFLVAFPALPVIALGLWWNANTISHNFIHRPFFNERWANQLFAAYLSLLLGLPQCLWRDRHLAHHAGRKPRLRVSGELISQVVLVLFLWVTIAALNSQFWLFVYLPGYLAGLGLWALHGYYEHAHGVTSHYGALYNTLFFNDGFHAEHHANPALHWMRLPACREPEASVSIWPAPLRWLELFNLESLERLVLRSGVLQRFVLRTHTRSLRHLAASLGQVRRVAVVGGGLFPRTALILQRLFPRTRITIIDASDANLKRARSQIDSQNIEFVNARYQAGDVNGYDLVVFPLSFAGDRNAIYACPPARAVLVHDWIWRPRGSSRIVSLLLLKRINLLLR